MVALVGTGRMPAEGDDERQEARLFYDGATPGDAAAGDWGEWEWEIRCTLVGKRQKAKGKRQGLIFTPRPCRLSDPLQDSIKVMTLRVSEGLEFPVVALVGAGRVPPPRAKPSERRPVCSMENHLGQSNCR